MKLEAAPNGGVWVGGSGGLQFVTENGVIDTGGDLGLQSGEIDSLAIDSAGGLWIGIMGTGLVYLEGNGWEVVTDESGSPIIDARSCCLIKMTISG